MATHSSANRWQPIGGGYQMAELRVGLSIMNPAGQSIYCQPGDDAQTMRDNIAALDEISPDPDDGGRSIITDMLLSDYFV